MVTIVVAILLALMIWVGNSLTKSIETTARTDVRLSNIESSLAKLEGEIAQKMRNRYTSIDADRDRVLNTAKFNRIETRQEKMEIRLNSLEKQQIQSEVNGSRHIE
jgi:preprotein translocase subunit SecF